MADAQGEPTQTIVPETSASESTSISTEDDPSAESISDSGLSDDGSSTLESVSASIKQHRYENGRRYHKFKAGTYMFPNDEKENDRMDLMYHIWMMGSSGKLYQAPLDPKTQNIMDVGCGTGLWAIQMGDEMPSAKVIGTDLSPIQPSWVPPNVEFQLDDFEEDWTFKHKFDFIHISNLMGSTKDWPKLVKQCFKFLNPGGYLEIDESVMCPSCDDKTMDPKKDKFNLWTREIEKASLKHGRAMMNDWDWKELLKESGFTNVGQKKFLVPVGAWAKDKALKRLGVIWQVFLEEGLEAVSYALLTGLAGMKKDEVDEMLEGARESLKNSKIHRYYPFHYTWGQKPLDAED